MTGRSTIKSRLDGLALYDGDVRRFVRPVSAFAAFGLLFLASAARGDGEGDAGAGEARPNEVRYEVRADAELTRLEVSMCFDGEPPDALTPGIEAAGRALAGARTAEGRVLPTREGRIDTSSLGPGACLAYSVDVEAARRAARFAGRYASDVQMSQGAWLWRDPRRAPALATVRFELPEGLHVAAPWPRRTESGGELYVLDDSAFRRPGFVAFGRFEPIRISRGGVEVEAVRLGDGWTLDDDGVRRWLSTAIDGISTVQGRFPVDHLLVVLVPGYGRGMGFGMVRRGGGHSVAFTVGRESTPEDLESAWVTWHELSHLQLPALPQRDAWLYEGLATYYQEVLPARLGIQSASEAWATLADGFSRGAQDRRRSPLSREASTMMETGAFQRVYWAGTAFSLEADVRLRRRGASLDAALTRAAPAWRDDTHVWTSSRLCALWDRRLDRAILSPLRSRFASLVEFPDTARLLTQLGVRPRGDRVELERAELSGVRDAIMRRQR